MICGIILQSLFPHMEIELFRMTVLTNRNDQIFSREVCSMICQTDRPDWPGSVTSQFDVFFGEMIAKIIFNNYLLLNEIELVHILFHVC